MNFVGNIHPPLTARISVRGSPLGIFVLSGAEEDAGSTELLKFLCSVADVQSDLPRIRPKRQFEIFEDFLLVLILKPDDETAIDDVQPGICLIVIQDDRLDVLSDLE